MQNSFKLFTQNDCPYCVIMKKKLDEWGIDYETINVSYNSDAKVMLKYNGHRTVPQLYYGFTHLNKVDTSEFTKEMLLAEIKLATDNDSGVEMFG